MHQHRQYLLYVALMHLSATSGEPSAEITVIITTITTTIVIRRIIKMIIIIMMNKLQAFQPIAFCRVPTRSSAVLYQTQ